MMTVVEWIFWLSAAGVVYAYAGYALCLWLLSLWTKELEVPAHGAAALPSVTVIIPVHNERSRIEPKLTNTRALRYPVDRFEVLFVSDGSTDGTAEFLRAQVGGHIRLLELTERGGKAAGLNAGLVHARHDVIVFSDASILLEPDAIAAIVRPFASPAIGCVSGEDHIEQVGGEGLYGRYELFLRRQESRVHSIVGASGSFYAQRRELCDPFPPGLAPDFFSVLRTVDRGYRAVTEPAAVGAMTALGNTRDEFQRKVRTLLRGMTTLGHSWRLLNPLRFGLFAFELFSHKLMRWLVPFFLLAMLMSSAVLATVSTFYFGLLLAQVAFYALALAGFMSWRPLARALPTKISVYFTASNLAILAAWLKYFAGARQELWSPSRR